MNFGALKFTTLACHCFLEAPFMFWLRWTQDSAVGSCLLLLTGIPAHFIIYLLLYSPIMDSPNKRGGIKGQHQALSIADKVEVLKKLDSGVSMRTICDLNDCTCVT
ncbi:hypothetical protein BsWGS_09024 [Bradybaena similaris]